MEAVRIACVRYLNTLPLIHGLDRLPDVNLLLTVPSRIEGLVRTGAADVGLVSLVDAAAAASGAPIALLPTGMIGCDGPTLTVRLFSSVPLSRASVVHADTDSRTSVVLCQVLLHHLHGVRPRIVPFDARERIALNSGPKAEDSGLSEGAAPSSGSSQSSLDASWPETVLLIGDKVITDPPPADRFPHQLDLGQAWNELTGLPFVYAAWACRAGEVEAPRIRTGVALLDRQRRRNALRLDWIADRFAPDHRWPAEPARRYLGSLLRYDLGPREREGAERFLAEAAALGLVASPDLAWGDARFASADAAPHGA